MWGRRKLLAAEAVLALSLARLMLVLPFRWLVAGQQPAAPGPLGEVRPPADPRAAAIGVMVERAERVLPWHSTCLVKALAARMMLRRRAIPSELHFGVAHENGALTAHAWLKAGGGYVCGGPVARRYAPLAAFTADQGR